MKLLKRSIAVLVGIFAVTLAGAAETPTWMTSLQSPVSAPVRFYGEFIATGRMAVSLGMVTAAITNDVANWNCDDKTAAALINTPLLEVNLEIYKTYSLVISGANVYDAKAYLLEPRLTDLLSGKGKNAQQYNRYRLYVRKPSEVKWELLCKDSPPGWNAESDGTGDCANMNRSFEIQLRPDAAARPVIHPGLSATYGADDIEVWDRDEDPKALISAPGDEDPLAIAADKTGYSPDRMSVTWGVNLGRLRDGQLAGKVRIIETGLSSTMFTPAALVYSARSDDTTELDVITAGSPEALRQIKAPEAFVDVQTLSGTSYELRFYTKNVSVTKANGVYTINGNPSPFVTWRIDDGGAANTLRIQEIRNGVTKTSLLAFTSPNLWTLTRGQGNEARIVTRQLTIQPRGNLNDRIELEEIKDGAGNTSSKTQEFWTDYVTTHELTSVTSGVGGPGLVTSFVYTWIDDSLQLISANYPDGFWERREYEPNGILDDDHPDGALTRIVQPWKDSSSTSADNDCLVTSYIYPHSEGEGSFAMERWHDGNSVGELNPDTPDNMGRNLSTVYTELTSFDDDSCSGAHTIVESRKFGGNYGETVTTRTFTGEKGRLAGQIFSKEDGAGKLDLYKYAFGQWDSVNRVFTGASTNDLAQIIYHGTSDCDTGTADEFDLEDEESPSGLTSNYLFRNKSTKEVRIVSAGRLVAKELYVYIDPTPVFSLVETVVYERDVLGHLTKISRYPSSGSGPIIVYEADWKGGNTFSGDLKVSETDENGTKTLFTYDSLKRLRTSTKEAASIAGYPTQGAIVTTLDYDASGNVLASTVTGGPLTLRTTSVFDLAGRLSSQTSVDGLTTTYSYPTAPNGTIQTNITYSSGATQVLQGYLDRRPASITGTAVWNQFFDYWRLDFNSLIEAVLPKNVTLVRTGSVSSLRWSKAITEPRNQLAEEAWPGFHSQYEKHKFYNRNNRDALLANVFESGLSEASGDYESRTDSYEIARPEAAAASDFRTDYDWNFFGEVAATATDADSDFLADLDRAGPDRVTESNQFFEQNGQGDWFKVSEQLSFPRDGISVSALVSRTKERLSGFTAGQFSQIYTYDPDLNETAVTVTVDRANKTVTTTRTEAQSSLAATQVTVNGLLQKETTTTVSAPTWHYYDALARGTSVADPLGFTSSTAYDPVSGRVSSTTSKAGKIATYQYYPAGGANAGLLYCETGPTGKKSYKDYNTRGQVTHIWGDVPYPQQMEYNDFGDLIRLTTYRASAANFIGTTWPNPTGGDVTTWTYDEPTGLLVSKTDAAGQRVTYDYYVNHLPKATHLARGGGTLTTYFDNGDLKQIDNVSEWTGPTVVSSIVYSDYNRLGSPRGISDAGGQHTLAYDDQGRLLTDTGTSGLLNGTVLTYHYDPVRGKDRVTARTPSGTQLTTRYGFDGYGRINSVSDGGSYSAFYAYVPNADLLQTTTSYNVSSPILTATRTWEFDYRLKSIANVANARTVTSHTYDYDDLDRRYRATLEDGSVWNYLYNDRNELISGKRSWSDSSYVAGQQFQYGYDLIGNRTTQSAGGDANGANLRTTSYTPNNLNQYSEVITPGYTDIRGLATASDTVTINSGAATRKNDYFDREIAISNGSGPVCQPVTVSAGANNGSGNLIHPKNDQTLTYDQDGNLTSDGIWTYQWDAQNRLTSATMGAVPGVPNILRKKLDFVYDAQGRRIAKTVSMWNGSTFATAVTTRYINDGWRLVGEVDGNGNATHSYLWGLDLSGTLDGAGGTGGLLMVRDHAGGSYHFPGSDGNGNVTVLINAANQSTSARYEYSPYGELLRATGPIASLNSICWSSKYYDRETRQTAYPARIYAGGLARWLNRDPLGENGGQNLYAFVANSPVNGYDAFGAEGTLIDTEVGAGEAAALDSEGGGEATSFLRQVREWADESNQFTRIENKLLTSSSESAENDDLLISLLRAGEKRIANAPVSGERAAAKLGRIAHNLYDAGEGFKYNRALPNGWRPDAVDAVNGIVRELKPFTKSGIRAGTAQLKRYVAYLNSEFPIPGGWKAFLDFY